MYKHPPGIFFRLFNIKMCFFWSKHPPFFFDLGGGKTTTTIITTRSWWHGGVGKVKFQQSTQGRSGTGEKETHYINVLTNYLYI